jgi:hypothetical protein
VSESTGHRDHEAAPPEHAAAAAVPQVETPAIVDMQVDTPAVADISHITVEAVPHHQPAPQPSSVSRFRAYAAEQMEAARARINERGLSATLAVALVAAMTGAAGAALTLNGRETAPQTAAAASRVKSLDETITRLQADLAALKADNERNHRQAAAQASKAAERLERIEKAQAEPASRLAKLTDSIEKLRIASVAAPAPQAQQAAAREVTGSIAVAPAAAPAVAAPVPLPAAKPAPLAPLIVQGWTLRGVDGDLALIHGRHGVLDVYVGDDIPGVGRVEAIRKQDGRWAVVTAKGLIVAR